MNSPASSAAVAPAQPPAGTPIFDARDRITVLTPCYDFSLTEYYHVSLEACRRAQAWFRYPDGSVHLDSIIAGRMSLPNDSHIDRARNVLTNLWVREYQAGRGTRKALWWDADIEKHPQHILRLYLHTAAHGHKFVCGAYACKSLTPAFIVNVKGGAKPDPESGLIEALHAGTGCMLWDIDVPLSLQKHPRVTTYTCAPNTPWPGELFYDYFQSGVYGEPEPKTGRPQWQSEDWMVCMYWQDLGHKVLVDTEIKLRHLGRMLYPPTVDELIDATCAILRTNHPAIDIARLREAVAKYQPPPQQLAA